MSRELLGVKQKRQDRAVFNFICQSNCVNPQQVKEISAELRQTDICRAPAGALQISSASKGGYESTGL